ncbi:MAG: peroxiredoxin family protein [Planctomycetota bacterium]|jgi:hypothetical protein
MEKSREAKTTDIKCTISIVLAACLLTVTRAGLPSAAGLEDHRTRFVAVLPNKAAVELIGVTFHSPGAGLSERKLWWRPDGSDLRGEPYRALGKGACVSHDHYCREFVLRVTGTTDYSCAVFNSLGRSTIRPAIPFNEKNEPLPTLRGFVCQFPEGQSKDTIRIGVSAEPWQTVEQWTRTDWHRHDSDDISFGKTEHPFILSWPRQKGRAVAFEMVHTRLEEALRLIVADRDGNVYERTGSVHGEGTGLIKCQFTIWDLNREDISRIEVQRRPYQWVEFRDVSLRPGHMTKTQVNVMPARRIISPASPSHKDNQENLGDVLDRLVSNTRFPTKGHAIYEIEESFGKADSPRVLKCENVFRGSRYRFEVETVRQGGLELGALNYRSFFDGEKTTHWYPLENKADIREGRKALPVYRLEKYSSFESVKKLMGHDVQVKGPDSINGIPCLLLECVVSAKERIKVWVTSEPDIYPLRIEGYEFDNLRYLYEAENVRRWGTALFPEKTTIDWYKLGDSGELFRISRKVVTLRSFSPAIQIADEEFKPEFPHEGISVTEFETTQPQAADFGPALVRRPLPDLGNIKINFSLPEAKGKRILLCLFDINQRPSRHTVRELAKRLEQLKEKGVAVVWVQAAKLDQQKLNEWVKKNNIPVPVGMIIENEEQTRFNWGVRSLPWLILTDRQHMVIAEGFGLNELDRKIESSSTNP